MNRSYRRWVLTEKPPQAVIEQITQLALNLPVDVYPVFENKRGTVWIVIIQDWKEIAEQRQQLIEMVLSDL